MKIKFQRDSSNYVSMVQLNCGVGKCDRRVFQSLSNLFEVFFLQVNFLVVVIVIMLEVYFYVDMFFGIFKVFIDIIVSVCRFRFIREYQ